MADDRKTRTLFALSPPIIENCKALHTYLPCGDEVECHRAERLRSEEIFRQIGVQGNRIIVRKKFGVCTQRAIAPLAEDMSSD